jgi:thiol-disulfide isomerase/thioredoxin
VFVSVLADLMLVLSPPAWAGGSGFCGPAPAVESALDQLPRRQAADTFWQVYQRRLTAIEALERQYPDDVAVQQAYIEFMHRPADRDKVIDEYKLRHEQNPASAELDYLYALTLVGRDTPQAIKLLSSALETDPAFGLPHLELATIYRSQAYLDKAQSAQESKAFLDACPASLEGYHAIAQLQDKDLAGDYAPKLRALIESRNDVDAVSAYQTLWALEFKAHAPSEYGPLRTQVTQDLARLRQFNLENSREWYLTLDAGYNLVNDKQQADWADAQYMARFQPESVASDKWWDQNINKAPGSGASAEKKRAFYHDLFTQTGEWLKQGPDSPVFWGNRVDAIDMLDDMPKAEVSDVVDQALQHLIRDNGPLGFSASSYARLAEVLSKNQAAPKRELELAQKALTKWEEESKEPVDDLSTRQEQEKQAADRAYNRVPWLGYVIDGYLQLGRAREAEPQLDQMNEWMQDLKSLPGRQDSAKADAALAATYWGLRAREAELQGYRQDAMAFYENALLARFNAGQNPTIGYKDELADDAHRLWEQLGGTTEGWQLWYARPANDLMSQGTQQWETASQALPEFELADLNGKTWNLAALRGKSVFLDFWATWCLPCRMELPRLQKLAEQYKDRADVQFITLDLDENPGLVQPVVKQLGLSLVVIPAYSYAYGKLGLGGLPANWIVDGKGVVRLKGGGYDPGPNWEPGVKAAIDKVESGASANSSAGVPR